MPRDSILEMLLEGTATPAQAMPSASSEQQRTKNKVLLPMQGNFYFLFWDKEFYGELLQQGSLLSVTSVQQFLKI